MKQILFCLLLLLQTQNVYSCSCIGKPFMQYMYDADFIATVVIKNTMPDEKKNYVDKLDIELIDLYKGPNIDSLLVNSAGESACGLHTPVESNWLILAYENKDGDYKFDLCSDSRQLDKEFNSYDIQYKPIYTKENQTKLELLNHLRKESISLNDDYKLKAQLTYQCINDFKGLEPPSQKYALFEVTVDYQLNVIMTRAIKEFGYPAIDDEILNCVNNSVKLRQEKDGEAIPSKATVLVGLYYHPPYGEHESKIDQYDF